MDGTGLSSNGTELLMWNFCNGQKKVRIENDATEIYTVVFKPNYGSIEPNINNNLGY